MLRIPFWGPERWLGGYEHSLVLQRTLGQLPTLYQFTNHKLAVGDPVASSGLCGHCTMWYTDMLTSKTLIHINTNIF